MASPYFITTPTQSAIKDFPILIIDKEGGIGVPLAEALKSLVLPLIVSKKRPSSEIGIVHIPFINKLPRIPDNTFSYILIHFSGEKEIRKQFSTLVTLSKKSGAKVLLICSKYHASRELVEYVKRHQNAGILVYGDVFGPTIDQSRAGDIIKHIQTHKKIALRGMGLTEIHPISLTDLISLILDVVMGKPVSPVLVAFHEKRTELSFVRTIQRIDPDILLDFDESPLKPVGYYLPPEGTTVRPLSSIRFEQRIREALSVEKKSTVELTSIKHTPIKKRTNDSSFIKGTVLGAFVLLVLPVVITIVSLLLGYTSFWVSAFTLDKGNVAMARQTANVSTAIFTFAEPSSELLTGVGDAIGVPVVSRVLTEPLLLGRSGADAVLSITDAISEIESSFAGASSSDKVKASLKKAISSLQKLQALNGMPEIYAKKLQKEERTISFLTNLSDVLPQLMGYEGKKRYAILIHDNRELRSGGGYISVFSLVSFDKGKITEFKTLSTAESDAKLKGHIDPPFPLQRYRDTAHWYLADSAASFDSSQNATQAAEFIELETGVVVDAVVGVDFSFIRSMLALTGPIEIPELSTVITKDNLFRQLEIHGGESSAQAGGDAEFVIALIKGIHNKLTSGSVSVLSLARIVRDGIQEKHMLMTSRSPSIQSLLVRNSLISSPTLTNSINVFGVYENNVNGNKSNYYVRRNITQDIKILNDTSASVTAKLLYHNTSNNNKIGGEYASFVQLLLPPTSKLIGIAINGTPQRVVPAVTDASIYTQATFEAPSGFEVVEEEQYGKKVLGFLLTVKEREERTVEITYAYPNAFTNNSFAMNYIKQPGSELDEYQLSLVYPGSLTPVTFPDDMMREQNKLQVRRVLREDSRFTFTFK